MANEDLRKKLESMSEEELRQALAAVLEQEQPGQQQPKSEDFNPEQFAYKLMANPLEALDELYEKKLGVGVSKALPTLAQAVAQLVERVHELEAEAFLDDHPEFDPTEENIDKLEKIMQERGWAPGRKAYEDALAIAVQEGLIKPKEEEKKEDTGVPKLPNKQTTQPEEPVPEDLIKEAYEAPLEELEKKLKELGYFKSVR